MGKTFGMTEIGDALVLPIGNLFIPFDLFLIEICCFWAKTQCADRIVTTVAA